MRSPKANERSSSLGTKHWKQGVNGPEAEDDVNKWSLDL